MMIVSLPLARRRCPHSRITLRGSPDSILENIVFV
jgi:hypothetical protein